MPKCREIVEMVRTGKLVVTGFKVGPPSLAEKILPDLIRCRKIINLAGEVEKQKEPFTVKIGFCYRTLQWVCDRNRKSGGFIGCWCCKDWYAPNMQFFGLDPDDEGNVGFCISRQSEAKNVFFVKT